LLSVSFPIFTGGRIDAEVRTAWSFLREALLVESQTRRRITQEIDRAVRNLGASQDRIAELSVQLKAATDAFNQADASYKAGLATNLERVTAQDAMLQAQLALATETIDQKVLWLSLLRSCGTLRETMLEIREPTTVPATQGDSAGT
jgi:outer membrane protein TolC